MTRAKALLIALTGVGALVAVLVLSGCGGGGASKGAANTPMSRWQPRRMVTVGHPLTTGRITIAIHRGRPGGHTSPATFAVEVGRPLTLTVVNHTMRPHMFTAPGLDVSAFIRAGTSRAPGETTFTFTPKRFGVFRWYCPLPCGDGEMSGLIYAIIQ